MRLVLGIEQGETWLWFSRDAATVAPGPLQWQWLAGVGTIRKAARASYLGGIGETESPNVSATLNNRNRQASTLLGIPLRRRAEIRDETGALLFAGVISKVAYGAELYLEIEA